MSNNIRDLRLARGLTQVEVASICGVTEVAVRRWEHGEAVPRRRKAVKLAKVLGVSIAALGLSVGGPTKG
jgi:putative transcriptional regulator